MWSIKDTNKINYNINNEIEKYIYGIGILRSVFNFFYTLKIKKF